MTLRRARFVISWRIMPHRGFARVVAEQWPWRAGRSPGRPQAYAKLHNRPRIKPHSTSGGNGRRPGDVSRPLQRLPRRGRPRRKGPDLTDTRWIHGSTDADIARVIENGVPNTTMKKLGDALKPEQIKKLIAHIRSLARSPGESTWKPYLRGDPESGRKFSLILRARSKCEMSSRGR